MKNKRNYGIDIARLLAMFMVVLLHNLSNGGILQFDNTSLENMSFWIIENLSIVAVNLFALITGFLMVGHSINPKRLISLWIEVWFWSVAVTLLIFWITNSFDIKVLIKSMFPVLFKGYWYFNAYIVLYFLIPFLNSGFELIEFSKLKKLIYCLIILSVTVGFIGNLFEEEGYSALWLIILYLIGAIIRKIKDEGKRRIHKDFFLGMYFLGACISLIGEIVSIKYIGHTGHWLSYNSPIILFQSVALFIYLVQIDINNTYFQKVLKWASPLSFAVYLIDTNQQFFNFYHGKLSFITKYSLEIGLPILIVISILLFILFIFLGFVRVSIFRCFSLLKSKKNRIL